MTPEKAAQGSAMTRLLALGLFATLLVTQSAHPADKPPLALAKTGYLYAGGHIDDSVEGRPMVGHLYAEYMIPAKQTHALPITGLATRALLRRVTPAGAERRTARNPKS